MKIVKNVDCYSAQIEAYGPSFRWAYTSWVLLIESHWRTARSVCHGSQSAFQRLLFNLCPHLELNAHTGQCDQVWIFHVRWLGIDIGWRTLGEATPDLAAYSDAGLNLWMAWLPRDRRRLLPHAGGRPIRP